MWKEFRTFILRGNVIDLAVGVIIGAAFGSVVTSLVNDVLMPPLGYILGDVDFSDLFIVLGGGDYASLAEAQEAGAATINYGVFINAIIYFMLVGIALFFLIRTVNRLQAQFAKEEEAAIPTGPSTEEKLAETLDRLATVLEKKE